MRLPRERDRTKASPSGNWRDAFFVCAHCVEPALWRLGGKMKKLKLVMIGNGMAGVRTLEELLKLSEGLYDITVFGAEPHPNYNRILLSPVLAGEQNFEDIVLNDLAWYESNGIQLLLNRRVVKIDRIKRLVIADD
ncbi:Assimilatory nitrate reductase electron transfer subunit domain protein, partial [Pseudomonas syringae pv. primulae]